jgi:hypothetical protein
MILYVARSSKKNVPDSSGNMESRLIKLCRQSSLAELCLNIADGLDCPSDGNPHFTYIVWTWNPNAR